ncbi:MAG: two-component system response regulator [Verrucomicrobiales bacterium]|nr:two-component system response regulator [Verrucomicrobiales bacterium]
MQHFFNHCLALYAEDDPDHSRLMERAFEKAGREGEVQIVPNANEAIHYLSAEGQYADREKFPIPLMLLTDLKMPGKSGFQLIRWVREHPEFKRMPVAVLTSSRHDPDIQRAYALGANSFLIKPPTAAKLTALIDNLNSFWLHLDEMPHASD